MKYTQVNIHPYINYFLLIKPRETLLLAFIGFCTALIASGWHIEGNKLGILAVALILGSAGCNALTNFLDRGVDARMERTRNRVLPRGLIQPPEKSLFLIIPLILVALSLAWLLNPLCFVAGIAGILASSLWRKTITCTFFGMIAGCSPVLIGWFAVNPYINLTVVMICLLVALWIPVHVWSVILAKKEEYMAAELFYFPINLSVKKTTAIIFILTCSIFILSLALNLIHLFSTIYLIPVLIMGSLMLVSTAYLIFRTSSGIAWRIYKLSSFPYLGVVFIAMTLDKLL